MKVYYLTHKRLKLFYIFRIAEDKLEQQRIQQTGVLITLNDVKAKLSVAEQHIEHQDKAIMNYNEDIRLLRTENYYLVSLCSYNALLQDP